jgi:hypothetical protein
MDKIFTHRIGKAVRINDSFNIVLIPKCCSNTIKNLPDVQKINFTEDKRKDDKYYVIIRDPVERWKSGICQYIINEARRKEETLTTLTEARLHKVFYSVFPTILTRDNGEIAYDEHTTRQVDFIRKMYHYKNVTYVKMKKYDTLDEIFKKENVTVSYDNYKTETNFVDDKSNEMFENLKELVNDYCTVFDDGRIEKYLAMDEKLFKQAVYKL